jgi:molybdopterin/thiamine biosynthesis adenylyltransferase/rhodanese-related sulfurtransferase
MNKSENNERYARQISLKELGEAGQEKLKKAKVLVVGAGGLGCPALMYLAGAGVGRLGLIDFDVVRLSNLHRQVLFSVNDIGLSKAERAGEVLKQINPDIEIIIFNEKLTNSNTLNIFSDFDIILDGTDNFSSRYLINDACVLLNKTLVYGAISRFEGQIAIFNASAFTDKKVVNYRDLFPLAPADQEVLNCAEAGVIGVIPGIIGTMMANETIKLLTGIGEVLVNKLLTYNALNNHFFDLELSPRDETASMIPKGISEFESFNYESFCGINSTFDLSYENFEPMIKNSRIKIIDVRESGEIPHIEHMKHIHIPLSKLREQIPEIDAETIVLLCQTGKRSTVAAEILSKHYGKSRKIYSLKDGIAAWQKNK